MSGINVTAEKSNKSKPFRLPLVISKILDDNPHLELGDPMRGPVDSFVNGRWAKDPNDGIIVSLSPTMKVNVPIEPSAPLQPSYEETSFTGAKYLHAYSVVHPFEDKVKWLVERYGQKIECIHPETFDVTVVKIDEEVISRFNLLLVRYGLSY